MDQGRAAGGPDGSIASAVRPAPLRHPPKGSRRSRKKSRNQRSSILNAGPYRNHRPPRRPGGRTAAGRTIRRERRASARIRSAGSAIPARTGCTGNTSREGAVRRGRTRPGSRSRDRYRVRARKNATRLRKERIPNTATAASSHCFASWLPPQFKIAIRISNLVRIDLRPRNEWTSRLHPTQMERIGETQL